MPASRRFRRNLIGQGASAFGQTLQYDVPRTVDYAAFTILVAGTLTNSVAWTAIKNDGILHLIKTIELVVNGSDVVYSISGEQALRGNLVRVREGYQVSVVQPGTTVAAHPIEFEFNLDMAAFGAMRAKDANLRSFDYTNVQLRINFGAASDIFTGAGASTIVFTTTCMTDEVQELFGADGRRSAPVVRRYVTSSDEIFSAAGTIRKRLDPNQLISGFSFRAMDATLQHSNAVLTNVKIIHGTEVLFDSTAGMMREIVRTDFKSVPVTGWYYIDLISSFGAPNHLSDMISTYLAENGNIDAYLELSTGAAGTVSVCTLGYRKLGA